MHFGLLQLLNIRTCIGIMAVYEYRLGACTDAFCCTFISLLGPGGEKKISPFNVKKPTNGEIESAMRKPNKKGPLTCAIDDRNRVKD